MSSLIKLLKAFSLLPKFAFALFNSASSARTNTEVIVKLQPEFELICTNKHSGCQIVAGDEADLSLGCVSF